MSVVVELRGGPLDGHLVELDALPWSPPIVLRIPEALPASALTPAASLESVPFLVHTYDRHPSPAEDGPVWRYVYRRPE